MSAILILKSVLAFLLAAVCEIGGVAVLEPLRPDQGYSGCSGGPESGWRVVSSCSLPVVR